MVVQCYIITSIVTTLQTLCCKFANLDSGNERYSLNTFSILSPQYTLNHLYAAYSFNPTALGLQRGLGYSTITQVLAAGSRVLYSIYSIPLRIVLRVLALSLFTILYTVYKRYSILYKFFIVLVSSYILYMLLVLYILYTKSLLC